MNPSFRFSAILILSAVLFSTAASASDAVSVVPPAAVANPRQPQAAIDADGTIYVTYASGETIYCSASQDDGKTFGEPVKVGELRKLALGMRRGPRVAAGAGFVVVTAIGHEAGDLLAWRSTDRGQHWQGPIPVSDSPKDAREGLHAMAAGPRGQLYCVWLDCRDQKKGNRIFGSGSSDGGQTWTENREVYASPSGTVCECCHPSVAFDSAGGLHAMWRNSLDGNRDLYAATSTNGGKSFGSAAKLGRGSWKLEGCPMDGGALAVTAPGKMTTIWRRQKEIYRTDSAGQAERLLGTGEQPWAASSAEGPWLVWVSRRGGDLFLSAPKAERPIKLAEAATDPMVVAPLAGHRPAIVVWETGQAKNTAIMAATVQR